MGYLYDGTSGIDMKTGAVLDRSAAFYNFLWMPVNIHRIIANVAFGGFVVGAYAAVKFMGAKTEEDKAHYDWMGYIGNFIGLAAFIPLPFAGYYLGREIYSASCHGEYHDGWSLFMDIYSTGNPYWNAVCRRKLLFMEWYGKNKRCGAVYSLY